MVRWKRITHIVLVDVRSRHADHTELVQSNVDRLADLAKAGSLSEGVPSTLLFKKLDDCVRELNVKGTCLNEGLGRKVYALGDGLAVKRLGGLNILHAGRIVAEWLRVALRARSSVHVARRTAAATSTGASGLRRGGMRAGHMRAGDVRAALLRGVVRVGADRALRAVTRTGVRRAVKVRNREIARHVDCCWLNCVKLMSVCRRSNNDLKMRRRVAKCGRLRLKMKVDEDRSD